MHIGEEEFEHMAFSDSGLVDIMNYDDGPQEDLQRWPPWPVHSLEQALRADDEETFWRFVEASARKYCTGLINHLNEAVKNFKGSWKGESPSHAALKMITYAHFATYRDLTKMPVQIHYERGYPPWGILDLIIQDRLHYALGRARRLACECETIYHYQRDPNVFAKKLKVMRSYVSIRLITGYFFTLDTSLVCELLRNKKSTGAPRITDRMVDGKIGDAHYLVFPPQIFDVFLKVARRVIPWTRES